MSTGGFGFRYQNWKQKSVQTKKSSTITGTDEEMIKAVQDVKLIPGWETKLAELMYISRERLLRIANLKFKDQEYRKEFINKSKQLIKNENRSKNKTIPGKA